MVKIFSKIKNNIINYRIRHCKYVHLMFNDKFNKPYVEFLNRNFNSSEHLILCRETMNFPFPYAENVIKIKSLEEINLDVPNVKKIICHSLFDVNVLMYLYQHPDILCKAYWVIWGGDLYNAPKDEINTFVRNNIKGYVAVIDGDQGLAAQRYSQKAELFHAPYVDPITTDMLRNARRGKSDIQQVLINNSCDKTTLDMLDVLSKFKSENICINTILSYGDMAYKEQIVKKGQDVFGNKFNFIDTFMAPEVYTDFLAGMDVVVLNQNRQQGVGNCLAASALGAKLYVKSDLSTFSYLQQNGIMPFDTYDIENLDFSCFVQYTENTKRNNSAAAFKFFADERKASLWQQFFLSIS